MSSFILIIGTLVRAAERRTSGSGRPFVKASLRSTSSNTEGEFWDLLVFSESTGEELLRLEAGDKLSVHGSLKVDLYAPEGRPPKINRAIFVDGVLPLRAKPKERKAKNASPKRDSDFGTCGLKPINIMPDGDEPEGRFFSDSIPF